MKRLRVEEPVITELRDQLVTNGEPRHRALVVFNSTAVCDGCGAEARLYTDGVQGYVDGFSHGFELVGEDLERIGAEITGACPRPVPWREECHGRYTWTLDEPGTWTGAEDALEVLARFGTPMEVTQ